MTSIVPHLPVDNNVKHTLSNRGGLQRVHISVRPRHKATALQSRMGVCQGNDHDVLHEEEGDLRRTIHPSLKWNGPPGPAHAQLLSRSNKEHPTEKK